MKHDVCDPRFSHPLGFVKENILGCFEASKSCCLIPGKPHLYHVEFLLRENSEPTDGSQLPVDHHLQAHFSQCEEVSWYLHQRAKLEGELPTEEADPEYVAKNSEGVIQFKTYKLSDAQKPMGLGDTEPWH